MQYHIRSAFDYVVFDENIRPVSMHKTYIEALFAIYKLENNLTESGTAAMLPTRLTPICACFVCSDQALFELEFRTGSKYVCAHCGSLYSALFERDTWRETIYTDLLLIAEQFTRTSIVAAKLIPELLRPEIADVDNPDVSYDQAMDYIWRYAAKVSCRQKTPLTQTPIFAQTFGSQVEETPRAAPRKPAVSPASVKAEKQRMQDEMAKMLGDMFGKGSK